MCLYLKKSLSRIETMQAYAMSFSADKMGGSRLDQSRSEMEVPTADPERDRTEVEK